MKSSAFKTAGKIIGGVEDWVAVISFMLMVVVTIVIVLCRYVFKVEFMQGEEIARYVMIWCGYSGAAYCFRNHGHVGVVVFSEMFPKAWYPAIVKIRNILSAIVVAGLFIFTVMCFEKYLSSGQLTTATRIPIAYVFVVIPVSMALGVIHCITDVVCDFTCKTRTSKEVTE